MNSNLLCVDLTRTGWRQLAQVNAALGICFLRAFLLKQELASYIASHEAEGIPLDTICQEVRYDDTVCLLLRKVQGIWYITDIYLLTEAVAFVPLYLWQRIKLDWRFLLVHTLVGWRRLTEKGGYL